MKTKITFTKHWPSAEYRNGVFTGTLSTSEPCMSIADARGAVSTWAQDYHLLHAWIESDYATSDGRTGVRKIVLF